jgi:hypothetical protein
MTDSWEDHDAAKQTFVPRAEAPAFVPRASAPAFVPGQAFAFAGVAVPQPAPPQPQAPAPQQLQQPPPPQPPRAPPAPAPEADVDASLASAAGSALRLEDQSSSAPSPEPAAAAIAPPADGAAPPSGGDGAAPMALDEPVPDVDEGRIMEAYKRLLAEDPRDHLNVVFIGHVDAGKSTLGGRQAVKRSARCCCCCRCCLLHPACTWHFVLVRAASRCTAVGCQHHACAHTPTRLHIAPAGGQILYLTGGVDKRTIEKYEREAKDKNRESWYMAYIMDTNEEERVKGITVEVSVCTCCASSSTG